MLKRPSSPPSLGVNTGDALGNYKLERLLGSGGQAEVWLATDVILQRLVAVKIFHKGQGGDIDADGLREARLIATLDHPNIVRIYHVGNDLGVWYMATEFVDGGSLHQRLKRIGALKPEEALQLASAATDALQHAHHIGVIHRDLKPQNFLITRKGVLKLADFGLASLIDYHKARADTAARLVGTPQFMPPEIWAGKTATVETDIYSLGACLYFMATGEPPFPDPTVEALKKAHLERQPIVPTRVPSALANLILYCMSKRPSDRPASAKALHQELQYCLGIITGDRRLRQLRPARLDQGKKGQEEEPAVNWSAAERAVLELPPFGPAAERLSSVLQGVCALAVLHGPHTKAHGLIVRRILDSSAEKLFLIARLVLGNQSGDLVSNLAKLLNITGASVPRVYDQIAEELQTQCTPKMPGIMHLHLERSLKPMEAIQLVELCKRADNKPFTLLVTCAADAGSAIVSEVEASGCGSLMHDIPLRRMTHGEVLKYFQVMTEHATDSGVWWSRDALLLAADYATTEPDTLDRIGQNSIMMALLTKSKVVTSWCVVGAAAHQNRLVGHGDLMEPWRTPPSVWPDEHTLQRLVALRQNAEA